ncbi:MAG: ATP-binding protein [Gammaproteobacteria bacterium]|jgi:signal transduction histidine kinase
MVRSNLAITRLLVLPYGVLLVLYLLVVGGGGAWLYLQVRAVETRLLIDGIMTAVEPLVEKLDSVDKLSSLEGVEPWLLADVQQLFSDVPSLRTVSIRGRQYGFAMHSNGNGEVLTRQVAPLTADARRASTDLPAEQRLHSLAAAIFLIRFDLTPANPPLLQLEFGFDRNMLLTRIDEGVESIMQAILLFGSLGGMSILVALGITVVAMRNTQRLEGHFQEISRRASISEMAAELVHDLRNPLMVFRTNVKTLLVSPEQTQKIVEELDRDIVTLNDKLNAFLDLTRRHDDAFEATDIRELVQEAVRLSKPVLAQRGLTLELDIPPHLPRPAMQKTSMRDALLNVILNAGQSGQAEGAIRIRVREHRGCLTIAIEDRGEGIPEKNLPRLFDAYFTTRADGTGLGLAIVRNIVAAHQGKVHIENRPEGGARVVFTLPLFQQEVPRWWKTLKKISPV